MQSTPDEIYLKPCRFFQNKGIRENNTRNFLSVNALNKQSGQELVEFAIILPLLLLLVFGAVDLGRLFHAYITISNAAREGARYGIIYPDDTIGILTITRREAQQSGLTLNPAVSAISISFPQGRGQQLPIRVTVTYHFHLILAGILTNQDLTLSRSAEMMVP